MSADSVAQDQIVAFVDRILRLKEEAKAINADIREIYAEAKGNGFDKTVLGKLVTYVEKRSSDPNQLNEAEAIFDLYLEAYDSAKGRVGTARATHRHAPETAHSLAASHVGADTLSVGDVAVDMATGEIIEPQPETAEQSQGETSTPTTSFADTEGNEGQHPIQPETANETRGGFPVAAASGTAEETGAASTQSVNMDRANVSVTGVTGGESAASNPNSASKSPQTMLVGEGSRIPQHTPAAPLDNSADEANESHPSDAGEQRLPGEDVPAVRSDSRSGPEGGSAYTRERPMGEPPERGPGPLTSAVDVTAGETAPRFPGATWLEHCPPAPVRWHEFSRCFPELWGPGRAELSDDIRANGVTHPIVKIGDEVLDGRARYTIARELGMEYPVTEYAGADPLADVIRWNLASRQLSTNERKAIATKLMKLPNVAHRASEIAQLFGLETEEAA